MFFKKKLPIFFQEDRKNKAHIEVISNQEGDYRFKYKGKEFSAIDYNPRSQLYRFENFVISKVANDRKNYVAYEITKEDRDLKLITTPQGFMRIIALA